MAAASGGTGLVGNRFDDRLRQGSATMQETATRQEIEIEIPPFRLGGTLAPPEPDRGLVLFAHGSGSSRFSPRNRHVAEGLREAGLGTLLFDLLTEAESADRRNVFDIPLLASRLLVAADYVRARDDVAGAPIGFLGASTGGGAALVAAARAEFPVGAVVSRGGRPDLAGDFLRSVKAPTLLIVGSLDHGVIELNEAAYAQIRAEKRIAIVEGATHLFDEPGTLDEVIELARTWFSDHLRKAR